MLGERRRREVETYLFSRARGQKGTVRWYADFRAFREVGGGREALVSPGRSRATDDKKEALLLADNRLRELEDLERFIRPELSGQRLLAVCGRKWLRHRAKTGGTTKQWMKDLERHIQRAAEFFGADRDLSTIGYTEWEEWHTHLLLDYEHCGGIGFSESSAHKHLCSLSAVYEFGAHRQILPRGRNPVPPSSEREVDHVTTPYLEVPEMAEILRFLLEEYRPTREDLAVPFAYEIVATAALTGGRKGEVTRLKPSDIDFVRKTVTFTRRVRRRKGGTTKTIIRTVPLHPQLEQILRAYLAGPHAPTGTLLFPQYVDGTEQPLGDLRKVFVRIDLPDVVHERAVRLNGDRAEGREYQLSWLMLRHTYCTARLQTLDRGQPIAKHTVMHEMGHKSEAMINKIYGHLGTFGSRSEHVEYRWTSNEPEEAAPPGRAHLRLVR